MEERLLALAGEKASGQVFSERFMRGIRYSLAVLDNDSAGLAFSFPGRVSKNEKLFSFLSELPLPVEYPFWTLPFLPIYPGDRCCCCGSMLMLSLVSRGKYQETIPSLKEIVTSVFMVGFIEPLYIKLW